jgi:hypothetical protein
MVTIVVLEKAPQAFTFAITFSISRTCKASVAAPMSWMFGRTGLRGPPVNSVNSNPKAAFGMRNVAARKLMPLVAVNFDISSSSFCGFCARTSLAPFTGSPSTSR